MTEKPSDRIAVLEYAKSLARAAVDELLNASETPELANNSKGMKGTARRKGSTKQAKKVIK